MLLEVGGSDVPLVVAVVVVEGSDVPLVVPVVVVGSDVLLVVTVTNLLGVRGNV